MNTTKKIIILAIFLLVAGLFIITANIRTGNQVELGDGLVPGDVAFEKGYVKNLTPPGGFESGLAWMQTIHDTRKQGESKVEVDWLRYYSKVDGKDILLLEDNYDSEVCGGLWKRVPWFGNVLGLFQTGGSDEFSGKLENGILVIYPAQHSDRVWHWWNCKRAVIPDNTEKVWMEAKVRITGPALIQTGMDFWKNPEAGYMGTNVNNVEAGVSDWYFSDPEWQIISLGKE